MNKELDILNEKEKEIVFSLSLMPYQLYNVPFLMECLSVGLEEQALFFDLVHDLSEKGFFERVKGSYRIKAKVSDSVIKHYHPGIEDCPNLLNYFFRKMEESKSFTEEEFNPVFQQLESILDKISKHNLHIAQLSYMLSSTLIRLKRYENALKYNQLALDVSVKIDNRHPLVALYYRDKAYIHKKLGNSGKAIYYSLKDIEILERFGGKYDDLLPFSYFTLSKTYEDIHNYEKAVEFNLKAIQFEKKKNDSKGTNLSHFYHNLAYNYSKLNNLHHARMFINKAVENYPVEKLKDNPEYLKLMKDQKKFNSLYDLEQMIRKYRIPILIFLFMALCSILWSAYVIFFL